MFLIFVYVLLKLQTVEAVKPLMCLMLAVLYLILLLLYFIPQTKQKIIWFLSGLSRKSASAH